MRRNPKESTPNLLGRPTPGGTKESRRQSGESLKVDLAHAYATLDSRKPLRGGGGLSACRDEEALMSLGTENCDAEERDGRLW